MWEARARKVKLRTDIGHELGDGSRWEDLRSIWLMQSAVRTCRSGRRQGKPGEDSDRNSSTTGTGQLYQSGTQGNLERCCWILSEVSVSTCRPVETQARYKELTATRERVKWQMEPESYHLDWRRGVPGLCSGRNPESSVPVWSTVAGETLRNRSRTGRTVW